MENKRQLIIFDSDDFYGLTADIVLFNLGQQNALKIQTRSEYERFIKDLNAKKYTNAVYVIDEFFGSGKIDLKKLLADIKANDTKSTLICYTVSEIEEVEPKDHYDHIVLKTSRELDKSLVKTLSDIYGVEFVADNNDPERDISSKN